MSNEDVLERCALCGTASWRERGFGLQGLNNRRGHLIALLCDPCYEALFHAGRGNPPLHPKGVTG